MKSCSIRELVIACATIVSFVQTQGFLWASEPSNQKGSDFAVVVEGTGPDVPSASQDAAKKALMQVVGSFVTSETTLEKRTRLDEGVRTESKKIESNIRDYSQGYISNFETQSTVQVDKLYRVTAKVTVRRDEFRTYITEYIVGSANVDGGGLFAQIAVEKDQTKNKLSILVDSLFPIFDGGVETFSVSPPARAFAGWIQFKVRRELNKD